MSTQPISVPRERITALCEREDLRDGTRAWFGPLLAEDRELLAEGYLRLSPASQRSRFLTSVPRLSESMLDRLVDDVDGIDHVALVAFVKTGSGIEPVGVGRMVRYEKMPDTADIAFTVQDAWQGRGIASILARRLCQVRPEGIEHLLTEVAADNPAPLRILEQLGEMQVHRAGEAILDVEVALSGEHLRLEPPPDGERLHPLLSDYARQILRTRDLVCDELARLAPLPWLVVGDKSPFAEDLPQEADSGHLADAGQDASQGSGPIPARDPGDGVGDDSSVVERD